MSKADDKIKSAVVYSVVKVEVDLEDMPHITPREALCLAEKRISDIRFRTEGGSANFVNFVESGEDALGALVDYQDDPEYDKSEYVSSGSGLEYLEEPTLLVLSSLVEDPTTSLDKMRKIFRSSSTRLAQAAARGMLAHPDGQKEDRRAAMELLLEANPSALFVFLEKRSDVLSHMSREDLQPLLTHENSAWRQKGMLLMGKIEIKERKSDKGRKR